MINKVCADLMCFVWWIIVCWEHKNNKIPETFKNNNNKNSCQFSVLLVQYHFSTVQIYNLEKTNTILAITKMNARLQFHSLCHQVFWSMHEKKASHHRM